MARPMEFRNVTPCTRECFADLMSMTAPNTAVSRIAGSVSKVIGPSTTSRWLISRGVGCTPLSINTFQRSGDGHWSYDKRT